MATPEERLAELGFELPAPFPAAGAYVAVRRSAGLLYVSGHGPMRDGRAQYIGKVGGPIDVATGALSAELTMLNVLASVKAEIGQLALIAGFARVAVFVNCTPDFERHPEVADGASRLLGDVFGEAGAHSRYAVGMNSLPFGITTEIDAVVELY